MMRILIADQQADVREAIRLLLEEMIEITNTYLAANVAELLGVIGAVRPDVVLLDWDIGSGRTHELISAIHNDYPSTRVIVMSARPEVRVGALGAAADYFICKGDPPEFLIAALDNSA